MRCEASGKQGGQADSLTFSQEASQRLPARVATRASKAHRPRTLEVSSRAPLPIIPSDHSPLPRPQHALATRTRPSRSPRAPSPKLGLHQPTRLRGRGAPLLQQPRRIFRKPSFSGASTPALPAQRPATVKRSGSGFSCKASRVLPPLRLPAHLTPPQAQAHRSSCPSLRRGRSRCRA